MELAARELYEDSHRSLATLPATRRHWAQGFVAWIILMIALLAAAPFADQPLPRYDAFVTAIQVVLVTTNLLTAYLLLSKFKLFGNTAVLILGSGYLLAALLCIPHALSSPGAVTSTGLIGGLQTAAWAYFFWHLAFAVAVTAFALLKDMPHKYGSLERGTTLQLLVGITAVVGLAGILSWLCIAADRFLPKVYLDDIHRAPIASYYAALIFLSAAVGAITLWLRRRSVLDVWLLVALSAEAGEALLGAVLTSARFTLGFYSSRVFSVITSTIVLAALLSSITMLHRRLAQSLDLLERERRSKMMNLEAVTASIAHEIRQPLAAIAANGGAALLLIERPTPDFAEIRHALTDIVQDSLDANHILASIRTLFKTTDQLPQPIDVNDIIRSAVRNARADLTAKRIELYTALAPDMPQITGYKSQIQEVVINVVSNAIEAMAGGVERPRVLRLTTAKHHDGHVVIMTEDSGPGISPESMETVFTPFVTTKAHGMGLGLAISRMIVERHGGRISASASELGGARFTVTLPTIHEFL